MLRHGLSKAGLAERIGVNPSTVTRWLDGTRTPDIGSIRALTLGLDTHPDEVLDMLDMRDQAVDMASDAVKRLQPAIDRANWDEIRFRAIEAILETYEDGSTDT